MKPTLVIMAAGMGSRFGGIKQIEPVGEHGELIIDYSIYDAIKAGFERVVFVIRRDIEKDFCDSIFNRIKKHIKAEYVFQDLNDLPSGFELPAGRTKPWGTAHAVWSARNVIGDAPFCAINADDFYGAEAFAVMGKFLSGLEGNCDSKKKNFAMVGYKLCNTVSAHGSVSRGVCEIKDGMLVEINERLHIERRDGGIAYTLDGVNYVPLPENQDVAMNYFGFPADAMEMIENYFIDFLKVNINNLKSECYIPLFVDEMVKTGRADVRALESNDRWLGMTNKEDKDMVKREISKLDYPKPLWK